MSSFLEIWSSALMLTRQNDMVTSLKNLRKRYRVLVYMSWQVRRRAKMEALSREPQICWTSSVGRVVSEAMMRQVSVWVAAENGALLVCGPGDMSVSCCWPLL